MTWYAQNKRDLPWRNTQDAYVIWLSEIILQQTRVEQGLPYFERFLSHYPSVKDFAQASVDEILKHWQGLGYYSRGRNMWHTAQEVTVRYNSQFPTKYADLIKLKGIGEYTAAAIASFSVNENKAVLDGNVFRVLARYFGISEAINSNKGKRVFADLAQDLIQDQPAQIYNQAIMEFGALQCKPQSPNCDICPLNMSCYAFKHQVVKDLPLKIKASKPKPRYFNYFVISDGESIYFKQRAAGDIWQGLYDFPLMETLTNPKENYAEFYAQIQLEFGNQVVIKPITQIKQVLSHQIIYAQFFALENYMINFSIQDQIKLTNMEEFKKLAHPKLIANFLEMYQTN